MFEQIETLFKKRNILSHKNQEITVANVPDQGAGIELAKEILYQIVDRRTVLYLSGGSTPKVLYEKLAAEEIFKPGAVGQIDERFGLPYHSNSNQLMIRESSLTRYLEILDIPFYPILTRHSGLSRIPQDNEDRDSGVAKAPQNDGDRKQTADAYDQKIRELNAVFPKSAGILGIGDDGHTAGIPAQNLKFKISNFKLDKQRLVTEFNDETGKYGERVTMTFLGLEMLDILLVLVFGSSKRNALDQMFSEVYEALRSFDDAQDRQAQGEKEIPARFFKRPDVARKTLLITDQHI